MLASFYRFLIKIHIFEYAIFSLLILVIMAKSVLLSAMSGHSLYECLIAAPFVGLMIPILLVLVNSFFCIFQPPVIRVISSIFVMPIILCITAFVSVPMAGYVPKREFTSLSSVEKKDVEKDSVKTIWEESLKNPGGPESEMVKNWESWNKSPYDSQFAGYDKEKEFAIEKQRKNNEAIPFGLKWILSTK